MGVKAITVLPTAIPALWSLRNMWTSWHTRHPLPEGWEQLLSCCQLPQTPLLLYTCSHSWSECSASPSLTPASHHNGKSHLATSSRSVQSSAHSLHLHAGSATPVSLYFFRGSGKMDETVLQFSPNSPFQACRNARREELSQGTK